MVEQSTGEWSGNKYGEKQLIVFREVGLVGVSSYFNNHSREIAAHEMIDRGINKDEALHIRETQGIRGPVSALIAI